MTRPIRVQRKRTKGWRMPPNTKSCTRPGKFGNPFGDAEEFRKWLTVCSRRDRGCAVIAIAFIDQVSHMIRIADDIEELRGFNLACFCPLDADCHVDTLLEFANREPVDGKRR